MGNKNRKRSRDDGKGENGDEAPVKRRRQINEEQLKLSKLYADLAAEADNVRLEAAKQLIERFSPENKPVPKDVEATLTRLIKGLCSQQKAARVGFSLTLTELLRQIYGQDDVKIEGLTLNVAGVLKLVEEKTKVEGNVPGRERRDHLIGKLFGFKAVLQSSITIAPKLSMECWHQLLDQIYTMARDVPWLREECGMVLVEAVRSLQSQDQYRECAKAVIDKLNSFKLVSTPEGVAIWLTVQASFETVLPEGIWHGKDPLSKKERSRLGKALKESFNGGNDGSDDTVKSAAANPNPTFTWALVLSEVLRRDQENGRLKDDSTKAEFPQFWIDIVDNNLFTTTSSHERKAWGFKIFSNVIGQIPDAALPALFSPNLMRTLINQSKKEDRYLHSAALAALASIPAKAKQDPATAPLLFIALTTKNGTIEFDKVTKTKTLEQIVLSADDHSLKKIVRHLNSLILRPDSEEQAVADNRRQFIADLLLNAIRQYKRYSDLTGQFDAEESWLRKALEVLVEYAYFIPSQTAKTSKVPLPPLSDRSRQTFQERLSSCLTKLLSVDVGSRSAFAVMVVGIIRSKSASSKTLSLAFKADEDVGNTLEKALQTMDAISAKGSIADNKMAAEGFLLLYSLTVLQVYNGEGDAVMMLEDLDTSREAMLKKSGKSTKTGSSDAFVEIVLSFLGNPLTLFRKIGEEAFSIFVSEISADGLQSLTEILDTEENLEGQKKLFNQGDDADEEDGSSDDSEDASDVEMIDGDDDEESDEDASDNSESDESSDSESDEDDDEELTQFNNMLALTLQTSKPDLAGGAEEDTSDESDMDDEQMMALDPHLSKIFQQRTQTTSKKKERGDAKQNVVQFKSRVLDLLAIYLEKQFSNPLTFGVLISIVRRTQANANKQLAEKASKILKAHFDSRNKHRGPLPKPTDGEEEMEMIKELLEEARLGGGSKMHADACSGACLHIAKSLIAFSKDHYAPVWTLYSEAQLDWFMDKKSSVHPVLFTSFLNWSVNARLQAK